MSDNKKSSLHIENLEKEREKFLFDTQYNPQFEYEEEMTLGKLQRYGEVTDELLPLAENILNTVIKKFGSEEEFVAQEGKTISREEAESTIREYIQRSPELKNKVKIIFSSHFIARTAVAYESTTTVLKVRLPIDYRENTLQAVLNHEVGTHIFRWINEELQPWKGQHNEYGFQDYLDTEEGLAVLHFMVAHPTPYLWMPALYYYTAYHAQFLSFSQLAQKIRPYVPNVERRWKTCLRVKRGLTDTSLPGAYTKDQVYLQGTVALARWLEANDYAAELLYLGKVGLADLEKAQKLAPEYQPLLPAFMLKPDYKKKLKSVIHLNKLLTAGK